MARGERGQCVRGNPTIRRPAGIARSPRGFDRGRFPLQPVRVLRNRGRTTKFANSRVKIQRKFPLMAKIDVNGPLGSGCLNGFAKPLLPAVKPETCVGILRSSSSTVKATYNDFQRALNPTHLVCDQGFFVPSFFQIVLVANAERCTVFSDPF